MRGAVGQAVPVNRLDGDDLIVSRWSVAGPLELGGASPFTTAVDDVFGIKGAASVERFATLFSPSSSPRADFRVDDAAEREFFDFQEMFGQVRERDSERVFAVAACQIEVPAAGQYWLLHASADGSQIFLNGELVRATERKRGLYTYDDIFPVNLEPGLNYVFVKVPRTGVAWGMTTRLVRSWDKTVEVALRSQGIHQALLLDRLVYASHESLQVSPKRLPPAGELEFSICDLDGHPVKRVRARPSGDLWTTESFAGVSPGLYTAVLRVGSVDYREDIVVGSIFEYAGRVLAAPIDETWGESDRIHAQVLRRRLAHLMKLEHRPKNEENWDWNRRTIHVLRQLELAARREPGSGGRFASMRGLGFRGFRSRIDDQIQQVRVFIPVHPPGRKLRLCVLLPTVVSANRPFIESAFAAAHVEAERIAHIAEKHGIAVLWSGYRNAPSGLPSESAHLEEAVDFIVQTYGLDRDAVFLSGACSGGALAVRAMFDQPDRYAGAALLNPVFGLKAPSVSSRVMRGRSDAQLMRTRFLGTGTFFDLRPGKVEIFHDGAEPGHGDLAESEAFLAKAVRSGYPAQLNRVGQSISQHMQAWDEMFSWIATTSPASGAKGAIPTKSSPLVVDLLADRVTFVVGTGGTERDRAACSRVMENLKAVWRRLYFSECPVRADTDVVDWENLPGSLVLLGNAATNAVWRKYEDRFKKRLDEFGARDSGVGLSYCIADPGQPNLVFHGSDDLGTLDSYDLNLLQDAWFSALVFLKRGRSIEQCEIFP